MGKIVGWAKNHTNAVLSPPFAAGSFVPMINDDHPKTLPVVNIRDLLLPGKQALAARQKTVFQRTMVAVLMALTTLGGFSSCQRATYPAYFPAAQRLTVSTPAPKPISDSLATASLTDVPPLATTPAWDKSLPLPGATAEAALVTVVRRPTIWSPIKRMLPRKAAAPDCDQIVLRNGDVVDAKVKEVGVTEIRYKKCDRLDGPDYTILKRDILSIKYSNGEIERFSAATNSSNNNNNAPASSQNDGPRTDPFAIVALSAGGLAILAGLGSILLGAGAVVFGALSLSRIRKEPGRFKGKGLALAGMIAGIVGTAGALLLYLYVV